MTESEYDVWKAGRYAIIFRAHAMFADAFAQLFEGPGEEIENDFEGLMRKMDERKNDGGA